MTTHTDGGRAGMALTVRAEKRGAWWHWSADGMVSAPTFTSSDAAIEGGRDYGYRNGYARPTMLHDGSLRMVKV